MFVEKVISERIKPPKNERLKESKNGAFTSSGTGNKGYTFTHPLMKISAKCPGHSEIATITKKHSPTAYILKAAQF